MCCGRRLHLKGRRRALAERVYCCRQLRRTSTSEESVPKIRSGYEIATLFVPAAARRAPQPLFICCFSTGSRCLVLLCFGCMATFARFFLSALFSVSLLLLHPPRVSGTDCSSTFDSGCSSHFVQDDASLDDSTFTLSVIAASRNDDFGRGEGSCNAHVADGRALDAEAARSATEVALPRQNRKPATNFMPQGLSAVDRAFNWVDVWACMALRHRVDVELLLVDWASDVRGGRLPLSAVFANRDGGAIHMCSDSSLTPPPVIALRIITVPQSFTESIPNPFNLTMLEHHAKNVGLRRARGRWYCPVPSSFRL
jgi:hypothetical protein